MRLWMWSCTLLLQLDLTRWTQRSLHRTPPRRPHAERASSLLIKIKNKNKKEQGKTGLAPPVRGKHLNLALFPISALLAAPSATSSRSQEPDPEPQPEPPGIGIGICNLHLRHLQQPDSSLPSPRPINLDSSFPVLFLSCLTLPINTHWNLMSRLPRPAAATPSTLPRTNRSS